MSNGDDVLDNWEEIDEAGVSIEWHYNNKQQQQQNSNNNKIVKNALSNLL